MSIARDAADITNQAAANGAMGHNQCGTLEFTQETIHARHAVGIGFATFGTPVIVAFWVGGIDRVRLSAPRKACLPKCQSPIRAHAAQFALMVKSRGWACADDAHRVLCARCGET